MQSSQCHRVFIRFLSLLVLVSLLLAPARASADDAPRVPEHVTRALVRVDAYEHSSLGVVVGDGHLVLVPFTAIEVARKTWPHAIVTDANGNRHDAGVAATDRASGLAILVVDAVLTTMPIEMSPKKRSDAIDVFAIPWFPTSGPIDATLWSFYPAGTLAGKERVPRPTDHLDAPRPEPTDGSPVIDTEGRLVAIMDATTFFAPRALDIRPSALRRLDGSTRGRRRVIFYGGMSVPFAFAPDGGLWFGLVASFGARIDDAVELRVDGEFSALVPGAPKQELPEDDCSKRECFAGVRGVVTPSIGRRFVAGGIGGERAWPIAVTPSIGYAVGVQSVHRENGAALADAMMPSTWGQVAPGLTLSLSMVEVRGRVRVPLDGTSSPTIELGFGAYF